MPGKASMSERGQSRHFDRAPLTSGLPEKQTFSVSAGMSQRCHWPPRGTAPASAHRADRQGIALAPTPREQTVTVPSLWTMDFHKSPLRCFRKFPLRQQAACRNLAVARGNHPKSAALILASLLVRRVPGGSLSTSGLALTLRPQERHRRRVRGRNSQARPHSAGHRLRRNRMGSRA
jgi:hypothetical protein